MAAFLKKEFFTTGPLSSSEQLPYWSADGAEEPANTFRPSGRETRLALAVVEPSFAREPSTVT
jgi:hypothetical protein